METPPMGLGHCLLTFLPGRFPASEQNPNNVIA